MHWTRNPDFWILRGRHSKTVSTRGRKIIIVTSLEKEPATAVVIMRVAQHRRTTRPDSLRECARLLTEGLHSLDLPIFAFHTRPSPSLLPWLHCWHSWGALSEDPLKLTPGDQPCHPPTHLHKTFSCFSAQWHVREPLHSKSPKQMLPQITSMAGLRPTRNKASGRLSRPGLCKWPLAIGLWAVLNQEWLWLLIIAITD